LGRNIDASATANWNGGVGFTPVAIAAGFDGQGYTISGLTLNGSGSFFSSSFVGLFAEIGGWGGLAWPVKKFKFKWGKGGNVPVNSATSISVGALAGVNYGVVSNVTVNGVVIDTSNVISYAYIGGLVGLNYNTITNAVVSVSVTSGNGVSGSGPNFTGGLAG